MIDMIQEKLLDREYYLSYTIGCIQELGIMVLYAILYNLKLIEYVRAGKYLFWGSGYLFLLIIFIFPAINILLKKYRYILGNAIGFAIYFFVFIPIGVFIGGGH